MQALFFFFFGQRSAVTCLAALMYALRALFPVFVLGLELCCSFFPPMGTSALAVLSGINFLGSKLFYGRSARNFACPRFAGANSVKGSQLLRGPRSVTSHPSYAPAELHAPSPAYAWLSLILFS